MKRLLAIQLPDLYAKDQVLIDVMKAKDPTWDRAHLDMQLFGAKGVARCLATFIAFTTRLARTGTRPAPGRS